MNQIIQIVAVDRNGFMAKSDYNGMLWQCKSDLKRFKKETINSNIIMGRKTYDSIGKPLPSRVNIVLTRDKDWQAPDGVLVAHDRDHAISLCEEGRPIYVIGGAEIYSLFEDITTGLHYTQIDVETEGDIGYPIQLENFMIVNQEFFFQQEGDAGAQIVQFLRRI